MSDSSMEREQRVLQEYDRVLDVPAAERVEFIRKEFAADPALAHDLERLLEAGDRAEAGLLTESVGAFAQPMLADLNDHSAAVDVGLQAALSSALAPRYRLEEQIGSGGMATVNLAFDSVLGRYVAIKVLRPELADRLTLDRFKREIAIAAQLDHPRIVAAYDRGPAAGVLYYVMRYVSGGSLRDRLARCGQLEILETISIARQVAEALDYAHAHVPSVVHRDIKPENILLDANGAYVADFGVARLLDAAGREHLTDTGIALGTALYMSPEQIEASSNVDGRSDVYSLACVIYEMLAGKPPYTGPTQRTILIQHMIGEIPDLCGVRPTITREMQKVIAAGLCKSSADRVATARELVGRLERAYLGLRGDAIVDDSAPIVHQRTIAVLPFANMSGDPANEYFSDGITEELIGALTRIGGMRVVARTSCFAFKTQHRDIREIGVALSATHVLEGSVRMAGRRLRASAQLVDAVSGNPLWSERYDRDVEDVFAVQDDITNAIVIRLRRDFEPPLEERRADTSAEAPRRHNVFPVEDERFGSPRMAADAEEKATAASDTDSGEFVQDLDGTEEVAKSALEAIAGTAGPSDAQSGAERADSIGGLQPTGSAPMTPYACASCGKALQPSDRFCGACGALVGSCRTCGGSLVAGDRFCPQCGMGVQEARGLTTPAPVVNAGPMFGTARGRVGAMRDAVPPAAGPDPWQQVLNRLRSATLGEFEIIREVGQGGMAAVYLAKDMTLSRKVAIKVLAPALFAGEGMVERFKNEAVTVAGFNHPNIIQVYAVRESGDLQFFVMKFVEGKSLDHIIREDGALQIPVIRALLFMIGSALGYAHRRGVVHRDIKPGNILLDEEGNAIVTDFGIAKVTQSSKLTGTGIVIGTPTYISPEQCYAGPVTQASDQYSLGIVAYEMLTGRVPFGGAPFPVMQAHTAKLPPPIRQARPDCPRELEAAVMRMLAKDPAERWPSIQHALAGLGATALPEGDPARLRLAKLAVAGLARTEEVFAAPAATVGTADRESHVTGATPAPLPYTASVATGEAQVTAARGKRFWLSSLMWRIASLVGGLWKPKGTRERFGTVRFPDRPLASRTFGVALPRQARPTPIPTLSGTTPTRTLYRPGLDASGLHVERFPAYDAYLRGRFLVHFGGSPTRSPESRAESLEKAIRQFDAAIEGNREFAPAYAARAYARTVLAGVGVSTSADLYQTAKQDADAALRLAPTLDEAHVASALVAMFFEWDRETALAALDRAIEISPAYAGAHLWRGSALTWLAGKPVQSITSLKRAMDLDPLSLVALVELAFAFWMKGDFEEARRQADIAVETGRQLGARLRGPDESRLRPLADGFASAHHVRAVVLAELSLLDEALADATEACRVGGRQIMHLAHLGMIHGLRGDSEAARTVVAELQARAGDGAAASTAVATVYAGLGDSDKLLAHLNDAYEARDVNLIFVPFSRHFAKLRSDPRFAELLGKLRIG